MRLQCYQKNYVTPAMIRQLQPIVSDPGFNMDNIKAKSCAATGLCGWVLAYYHCFANQSMQV